MRKCNFKAVIRWRLGFQSVSKWVKPYGLHGHRPAPLGAGKPRPITGHHFDHGSDTKMGQHRKMGWRRRTIIVTGQFQRVAQCAEQNFRGTKCHLVG
jgi:hypothetical protein